MRHQDPKYDPKTQKMISYCFTFENNETVPKTNSKPSKNTCKTIPKLKLVRKCKIYLVFTLKREEIEEKLLPLSSETTPLEENQSELPVEA